MPPSGDRQQYVAVSVAALLDAWSRSLSGFVVGANEAGMSLGGDIRAADVAVWRSREVGEPTGGLQRVAPVLAVEIAGRDEPEDALRQKASWYLEHGVSTVWVVLPATREIVVIGPESETRHGRGSYLPTSQVLPGLSVAVDDLFRQLEPA